MAIVNSFPAFNLTGAVHHYVRVPNDATNIYYLGACEVQPDVRILELSLEAKSDVTGRLLPGQKTDQGQKAAIGLQLSYYSELAYVRLQTMRLTAGTFASNTLQVAAGWEGRFARGSLIFGSKTFELWQVFERQTDANYRNANMPLGWYWPQVELILHAPVTLGNQEKQLLLVCEALPAFLPQASYNAVAGNERSKKLYGTADADFPAEVLIPQ